MSLCELGAGGRGFLGVFARRRHRHGLWAEFGRIGDAARIKGRAQCPLAYLQVAVQAWNGVSPSGLDQSAVERIQAIIGAYPYQEPTNL